MTGDTLVAEEDDEEEMELQQVLLNEAGERAGEQERSTSSSRRGIAKTKTSQL